MAKPHVQREFASRVHDALHEAVGVYHERLHELTRQEEKLKLQKAILKATAVSDLARVAPDLKLSGEAVSRVSALNW
jgi:hypothetical protein